MGKYYEICPVGENALWIVWREGGVEMKHKATVDQRNRIADMLETHDRETQKLLRIITLEGDAQ